MKRIYLFLVAFLICVSSSAQVWDNSKPDKRFTFGIRAGINTSSLSESSFGFSSPVRIGFHVGLNADINIIKSFAIETGLFLSEKGDYNAGRDINNKYIQLPILAMSQLFLSENTHLQVKGGMYLAFCIDGITNYYETTDAGIDLGIGFKYKRFYLGCQYEIGLIANDSYSNYNGEMYYNNNFTLSIGYDF